MINALRVLDAAAAHQPVGVSELARLLDLPKSSVQRILHTLCSAGWIQPLGTEMTRWTLTTHMLRVGRNAAEELTLRNVAVPVMEELRSLTQETVHLGIPEHDHVILIERLDSPQPVRTFIPLGTPAPLAASANGKAILATRSRESVKALLIKGIPAYTPQTMTDEAELLAELDRTRRRGYATNNEEWREGVAAVAAAVVLEGRGAIAGISVSAPAHRMSVELHERYGELVKDAANRISRVLLSDIGADQA